MPFSRDGSENLGAEARQKNIAGIVEHATCLPQEAKRVFSLDYFVCPNSPLTSCQHFTALNSFRIISHPMKICCS